MYEYVGNLHVHSTYSDGSGTIEEIAGAAQEAGIDFVGINDHNTLRGKQEGKEGWHGDVFILIGTEIGGEHNHYLSYGIEQEIPANAENSQQVISAVREQGGIGFLAHPFEKGSKLMYGGKAFTWQDWDVEGFTGICLWNYSSQWRDAVTSFYKAPFYAYICPNWAARGIDEKTMAVWDALCRKRRVVGIGGTDAHAVKIKYGPFRKTIFPYPFLFRTVNTHILTSASLSREPEMAADSICRALKKGHCFIGFDYYRSTRGFRFWAESGGKRKIMGDVLNLDQKAVLSVELPCPGLVILKKDGNVFAKGRGNMSWTITSPGVYRVEVLQRGPGGVIRPWIYSNPVYVV